MIEITHAQARRIIREEIDREVPGEQWNSLAAHLERCPDCCAYRERYSQLERSLRRGLRTRWNRVSGPREGLDGQVARLRRRSLSMRKNMRFVVLGVVLLVLLGGGGWYWRKVSQEKRQAEVQAGAAVATARARQIPVQLPASDFQGVVAFDAPPGSNITSKPDIFLLNSSPAGSELTNLTQNEATDSDPVWSPDGEWLAFLSDRDGKMEIYAMTVAGTHITRLTNDPAITWQGPLSWSADGQWIAAAGVHSDADGARSSGWIYRVAVGGAPEGKPAGLTPLPYSRGGRLPRYAPHGAWLAYQSTVYGIEEIILYNGETGRSMRITEREAEVGIRTGVNGAFDWSADARGLIYLSRPTVTSLGIAEGGAPDEAPLTRARVIEALDTALAFPLRSPQFDSSNPALENFPAASGVDWSPGGEIFALVPGSRGSETGDTCAFLTQYARDVQNNLAVFPKLCIESGLERSSWSTDGRWLIAAGHTLTEARAGIYAFSVPDAAESKRVVISDRLIDLPKGAGALRVRPNALRLSGVGPELSILPRPAGEATTLTALPPEDLLRRVLGQRARQDDGLTLGRLKADGSGLELFSAAKNGFCMRASPDGQRSAFIVFGADDAPDSSNIFMMDADGIRAEQLTRQVHNADPYNPDQPLESKVYFGCPVWSPDGSQMAAWVESNSEDYLAMLSAGQERYIKMPPNDFLVALVWSADGKELIVVVPDNDPGVKRIMVINAADGVESRRLTMERGHDVTSLALSPGGGFLAYTTTIIVQDTVQTELRIASMGSGETFTSIKLPDYQNNAQIGGYRELTWLGGPGADEPSMKIGLTLRGNAATAYQSAFLVFDPAAGKLNTLASVHEELFGTAWSPDRRWLLFSTSSGLWSLDVEAALAGQASPLWLSSQQLYELDWK